MQYNTDINFTPTSQRLPQIILPPNVPPPLASLSSAHPLNQSAAFLLPRPYTSLSCGNSQITSKQFNLKKASQSSSIPYSTMQKSTAAASQSTAETLGGSTASGIITSGDALIGNTSNGVASTIGISNQQGTASSPATVATSSASKSIQQTSTQNPPVKKRKRGRPRKHPLTEEEIAKRKLMKSTQVKRKRGRPRLPPLEMRQKSKYVRKVKKNKTRVSRNPKSAVPPPNKI